MKTMKQKEIKRLVNCGEAIDLSKSHSYEDIPERYECIAVSCGTYGLMAKLWKGESGQLYAAVNYSSAIYRF